MMSKAHRIQMAVSSTRKFQFACVNRVISVEVKQHTFELRDLAPECYVQFRKPVDCLDAFSNTFELGFSDEITFINDYDVGMRNLQVRSCELRAFVLLIAMFLMTWDR